ncbi:L,D-transpeptidase family protein [Akkermansia glycaniphila]|uniref:L d-transpeptidase catalytic domain n=1 Tax=Akkermansia glycaniphila TaxID=1679444 RepID=A0A1H6MES7_9BACT|nr:L,D-transpeptidase family protein [Akkermansia glycaniphila]MBT9450183.1 L,D-transpeptidase family protein [Akkermansia glycaniphila]SEH96084.1 l d-transpeptidase catalytic domain [Akkermansia glycaniphila]
MNMLRLVAAGLALSSLVSCSDLLNPKPPVAASYLYGDDPVTFKSPEERLLQGHWDNDPSLTGPLHIVIDLKQQKMIYYKGGVEIGLAPISTGKEGHGTPRGNFKILAKDAKKRSNSYGELVDSAGNVVDPDFVMGSRPIPAGLKYRGAPMFSGMQIVGGFWMHEGEVTGYPVSHGCIRLPEKMAKIFFANTPIGTPVTIR